MAQQEDYFARQWQLDSMELVNRLVRLGGLDRHLATVAVKAMGESLQTIPKTFAESDGPEGPMTPDRRRQLLEGSATGRRILDDERRVAAGLSARGG